MAFELQDIVNLLAVANKIHPEFYNTFTDLLISVVDDGKQSWLEDLADLLRLLPIDLAPLGQLTRPNIEFLMRLKDLSPQEQFNVLCVLQRILEAQPEVQSILAAASAVSDEEKSSTIFTHSLLAYFENLVQRDLSALLQAYNTRASELANMQQRILYHKLSQSRTPQEAMKIAYSQAALLATIDGIRASTASTEGSPTPEHDEGNHRPKHIH